MLFDVDDVGLVGYSVADSILEFNSSVIILSFCDVEGEFRKRSCLYE